MIAEQMAIWLVGSILFALGSIVLIFGLILINNLLHKYWKPVTIVFFRNESIYPKIRYSVPEDFEYKVITLKEWMELVDYRITEGSEYCWQCYGPDAYTLDSWNGDQNGHSFCIIFDNKTQVVYEVQAHDYVHNRAYRLINPDFQSDHSDESEERGISVNNAWDDVKYIDLDVDDDFFQKALAIREGEDYDTRVQIQVEFDDAELLEYMKIAHDRDITFNQLVEIALQEAIDQHRMLNDIDFSVEKKKKKKKKGR